MMAVGSTKRVMCEFNTVNTRCSDSSLDRIACDFGSLSLHNVLC